MKSRVYAGAVYDEKAKAYFRNRRETDPERKRQLKESHQRWLCKNRERLRTMRLRRSLSRLTPKWAMPDLIDEVYFLASLMTRLLGRPYEVDHIVPLRSPFVCGLHVEHNLAVLCKRENGRKSNLIWPLMPDTKELALKTLSRCYRASRRTRQHRHDPA